MILLLTIIIQDYKLKKKIVFPEFRPEDVGFLFFNNFLVNLMTET